MAKTYEQLLEQAAIIRDETAAGKNTAERVGGTITDAIDYVKELKDTYAGIHAEAAEAKTEAAAAKVTAAEAKTNAGSARSIAQSAVLTANGASITANEAKTTAQAAKDTADAAKAEIVENVGNLNEEDNRLSRLIAANNEKITSVENTAIQASNVASSANEAATAAQTKNTNQDARIEYLSQNTYYLQEGIGCAAFDYTMSLGDVPIQSEEVTRQDGDSIILDTSANRFVLERGGKFYTKFASGGGNMQGSEVYASSRHTFLNRQDKSYWYRKEDGTLVQGSSTFVIANWLKTLQSESDSTQEAAETARTAAQEAQTTATEAKETADAAKQAAENEATARTEADAELQSKINGKQDNIGSFSADEKAAFLVSLGLGKIGVVSQKQTWNDVGVEPAYVMSEKVEGFISKDNIDSLISYGFAFNEGTGYFELNGINDISLKEALNIVAAGKPNFSLCDLHYSFKKIRTNLPILDNSTYIQYFGSGISNTIRTAFMATSSDIEVFVYMIQETDNNYKITGLEDSKISQGRLAFFNCQKLEKIYVIPGTAPSLNEAFDNCKRLKELELVYLKCDVNLSSSAYLSAKSTHIMIATAKNSNAITITLHSDAKARWEASEYYAEDSQTIISKNITIA